LIVYEKTKLQITTTNLVRHQSNQAQRKKLQRMGSPTQEPDPTEKNKKSLDK
jgi:hypothetical protein